MRKIPAPTAFYVVFVVATMVVVIAAYSNQISLLLRPAGQFAKGNPLKKIIENVPKKIIKIFNSLPGPAKKQISSWLRKMNNPAQAKKWCMKLWLMLNRGKEEHHIETLGKFGGLTMKGPEANDIMTIINWMLNDPNLCPKYIGQPEPPGAPAPVTTPEIRYVPVTSPQGPLDVVTLPGQFVPDEKGWSVPVWAWGFAVFLLFATGTGVIVYFAGASAVSAMTAALASPALKGVTAGAFILATVSVAGANPVTSTDIQKTINTLLDANGDGVITQAEKDTFNSDWSTPQGSPAYRALVMGAANGFLQNPWFWPATKSYNPESMCKQNPNIFNGQVLLSPFSNPSPYVYFMKASVPSELQHAQPYLNIGGTTIPMTGNGFIVDLSSSCAGQTGKQTITITMGFKGAPSCTPQTFTMVIDCDKQGAISYACGSSSTHQCGYDSKTCSQGQSCISCYCQGAVMTGTKPGITEPPPPPSGTCADSAPACGGTCPSGSECKSSGSSSCICIKTQQLEG